MSTHLLLGGSENPAPGLAAAFLNLIVALALVCVSLPLGVTVSLLTWLHPVATADARSFRRGTERRAVA
jgi:hypothetical protein